jgi:SAM-dependent methyltransferase
MEEIEGKLDVIISNSCLEHIPSPLDSLLALREKLKNGGIIIFSVPHETIDFNYKLNDWNYHLYTWSPMAIGNLFNEAGFEVIKVKTYKNVQLPAIGFFENFFPSSLINFLSKIYRILRIILSETGLKQLAIDGDVFIVARNS